MPTQQELIDQQAEQEALRLQQEEEANKQAAQTTKTTTQTTPGVEKIGDFGGQEAFKVKGRPVNYGGTTVVTNQKVLDENLSRGATAGGWMLPPSISEEQVNRAFTPIAGEKPKLDQAKLDRLARMGRINEAGRVVGVAADVLGLGLGANVNKRPTDDLAAKLFDENDNVYKKLDDDKNKYRDKVAKWMNGRAAQPVYKTKTTTEKTNDIRETENVLLKTKPKDAGAGGKDDTYRLFYDDGRVAAEVKKDQVNKLYQLIINDGSLSAEEAGRVKLAMSRMGQTGWNDNEQYGIVADLALKTNSGRKFLGIKDGEQIPKTTPNTYQQVGGLKIPVSGSNTDSPTQGESRAVQGEIRKVMNNAPVISIDLGGRKVDVGQDDYNAVLAEVVAETKGLNLDDKTLKAKVIAKISSRYNQEQAVKEKEALDQYRNADGTPKPAAKITATGNDARQF